MTVTNHWGKWVDSEVPVTGVFDNNDAEYLHDDIAQGIDLAWEEHLDECAGMCSGCRCNHGVTLAEWNEYQKELDRFEPMNGIEVFEVPGHSNCDCIDWNRGGGRETVEDHDYDPMDEHDACGPQEMGEMLIGFMETRVKDEAWYWFPTRGIGYKPDPDAEYSAISREVYIQVVASKWGMRGALCSPCFVGQVNAGSKGEFLAYALPPDMYGDSEEEQRYKKNTFLLATREEQVVEGEEGGMKQYRVSLFEHTEDKAQILFDCWADDAAHAEEQAINAYPDATVTDVITLEEEAE